MTEKQFLLVGGAVVLVFLLLFGYLSYEEWGKYDQLQKDIQALETEIAGYRKKIAGIKDLRKQLTEYEKRFEKMRKILPNKAERENLIDVLNYLCSKTGLLAPISVSPVEERRAGRHKATGDIQPIYYDVQLQGTFFAFIKFTNWVEHYKRHIRLKTFEISGGGDSDTAGQPSVLLDYRVQLVSYQYTGDKGLEVEAPLELEEPVIDEKENYDPSADERRDPFIFPLMPVQTEEGPGGKTEGTELATEAELVRQLEERLEEAKILRRDVRRLGPNATTEELRSIVQRHQKLDKWLQGRRPKGNESGKLLTELRGIVGDIGSQIQFVWKQLFERRVTEVLRVQDDHLENRRYRDVVAPMLGLVLEFREFELSQDEESQLQKVFDKVLFGLSRLVEELSEYEQAINLIKKIETDLGPLKKKRTTAIYRNFIDGTKDPETGKMVGGLAEIKKKAEDIKLFRETGILVTGLIWRPMADDRICIVQGGRLKRFQVGDKVFERRLFGEGDVVGYMENETDTVRIKEITKFKKVIFEFRGLAIPQELGEPKPAR